MPPLVNSTHLTEDEARPELGSALGKALYVLNTVVSHDQAIGLAYLADELRLPKPTVHRILVQLEDSGLIERTPDKNRYMVGVAMNRLAANALSSTNQRTATRAVLSELVRTVGETCNVGVLDQHEVRYLERVECDAPLRVQIGAGLRVPAHCTALGKLFLAHTPTEQLDRLLAIAPLKRYTDNTLVDRAALDQELENIRQRGFSSNNEEFGVGVVAIAVPISDVLGNVLAGVAMHAPTPRMSIKGVASHRAALQDSAHRLALAWGLLDDGV